MAIEEREPFIGPIRENEYRCWRCHGVFVFARSDEEAVKESEDEFGFAVSEETHEVLCDPCYQAFMTWFNNRGPTGPGGDA